MPNKGTGVTGSTIFIPRSHNTHPTVEGSHARNFSAARSGYAPFDAAFHRSAHCQLEMSKAKLRAGGLKTPQAAAATVAREASATGGSK